MAILTVNCYNGTCRSKTLPNTETSSDFITNAGAQRILTGTSAANFCHPTCRIRGLMTLPLRLIEQYIQPFDAVTWYGQTDANPAFANVNPKLPTTTTHSRWTFAGFAAPVIGRKIAALLKVGLQLRLVRLAFSKLQRKRGLIVQRGRELIGPKRIMARPIVAVSVDMIGAPLFTAETA